MDGQNGSCFDNGIVLLTVGVVVVVVVVAVVIGGVAATANGVAAVCIADSTGCERMSSFCKGTWVFSAFQTNACIISSWSIELLLGCFVASRGV